MLGKIADLQAEISTNHRVQFSRATSELAISSFPFVANGRAITLERDEGFIRIVARKKDGLVLGIQAVGQGVSELSATFGLALELGATLEDIAGTLHAHPTLGEAFLEAALKGLGHPLHI